VAGCHGFGVSDAWGMSCKWGRRGAEMGRLGPLSRGVEPWGVVGCGPRKRLAKPGDIVHIRYGRRPDVSRFDRMKARRKKLKRSKRKRGPSVSFGELIRKLWQPEPEAPEAKAPTKKLRKSAAKGKRIRKS
jgi:hypothetical protein